MTDKKTDNSQPGIMILTQYIKDMSLELPLAPEIFKEMGQTPDVHVDINMRHRQLDDGATEVILDTKMDADVAGKKLFILELSYAALASLNVPEESVEPVIYIELPRLLFPFVRSIVANSMSAAGLPPIMISPIDFVALYQAKQAQREAEAKGKKAK